MPRGRNLILLAGQDWQSDLIGFCKGIAWKRVLEAEEERLNGHRMREFRYAFTHRILIRPQLIGKHLMKNWPTMSAFGT